MPFTGQKRDTLERPPQRQGPEGEHALSKVTPHCSSNHTSNLEKWSHIFRQSDVFHLAVDRHTFDLLRGTLKGQKDSESLVSATATCFLAITASFPT